MRYGFKAQAERVSLGFREALSISVNQRLNPVSFLQGQGIVVWLPSQVPNLSPAAQRQLVEVDPDSWSGLTVREAGKTAIIVNPAHPAGRQANTLMHEWSHCYLKHEPKRVDLTPEGVMLISDYAKEMEDEADWLAGSMLMPRDGVFNLLRDGVSVEDIAAIFGVSVELAQWRVRMTGVLKQLQARARW